MGLFICLTFSKQVKIFAMFMLFTFPVRNSLLIEVVKSYLSKKFVRSNSDILYVPWIHHLKFYHEVKVVYHFMTCDCNLRVQ